MPVNDMHEQYEKSAPKWKRCRHMADGSDSLKSRDNRVLYLPALTAQSDSEYSAYVERAMVYNGTGRTIQGLSGACFRKDPKIEMGVEALDEWLKDVTGENIPVSTYSQTLLNEVLEVGRVGVWVDMAPESERPMEGQNMPYLVTVLAENIRNWKVERQNGKMTLTQVVIEEQYIKADDPFKPEMDVQYRVLQLNNGIYEQVVWRKKVVSENSVAGGDEWVAAEPIIPTRRQEALTYIPFVFIGPTALTCDVEKPPLLDLVDVNLSHYRNSADLEHGRHFCGLPTPWVAGFPKEKKLRIGSNVAWVSDRPEAKAGMLEFTGQGLGALETALESKEKHMAALGARLLEEQKSGVEAAQTVMLRQSGEAATLQSMIKTVSRGLKLALVWAAEWAGHTDAEVVAALNTDTTSVYASPQELQALVLALQNGGMSFETYYANLERLEMTRPDVKAEDEMALIKAQEENSLEFRPANGGPTPEDEARMDQQVNAIGA